MNQVNHYPGARQKQQGVVLVAMLMLFAMATVIATAVYYRQAQFTARSFNLIGWDTRYQYAVAAEAVAIQALIDDLDDDRENDALWDDCKDEQWAITLPPTPYEDAILTASVQDLQGRFNLNWLVEFSSDDNAYVAVQERRDQLERLLSSFMNEPGAASALADEMADWLDSDDVVFGTQGAEDADYRLQRTPNMPIIHESELRALRSFVSYELHDPIVWQFITAIPESTPLNVNTAPENVLSAVLSANGGDALAQAILEQREQAALESIEDVLALSPAASLSDDQKDLLKQYLDVRSEYFQVQVDIEAREGVTRLVTRIMRPAKGITAVYSRAVLPILGPLEPACHVDYEQATQN